MRLTRSIAQRACGFLAETRAAAAVEFALLLPLLCLFYFGADEVTQGFLARQRAAHTASAIGDLVAQSSTITSAEVGDIFKVGATVLYPYPTASLKMRISSLVSDPKNKVTVAWSQANGMTALTKGASVSVSNNLISPNQGLIMAEASYAYTPAVGYVLKAPISFNEVYYLRPRLSNSVACADC